MAGKSYVRLKTVNDVSVYLAQLINQLRRDEVTESKAGKIGYLCNLLQRSLETGDLERRLEALEAVERER